MHYIGIDSGSTKCKLVLYKDEIIDYYLLNTTWNPYQSAIDGIAYLKDKHQLNDDEIVIATCGYGRDILDFADHSITEIMAHAIGGYNFNSDVSGIIDIGGQDCKIIKLNQGKVIDFYMNDKCAAGTGSFLLMTCQKLGIDVRDIDQFITADDYVDIVSMCAVFAESEIVGLLAKQESREKILLGVIVSIAQRIKQMLAKLDFSENDTLLLTGGLAFSNKIRETLEQVIGIKIITHPASLYAGALGTILHCKERRGD